MLRVTVGRLTDKACKAFVAQKAHDKEKTYSIGSYPAVSLAAARIELTEVKATTPGK
ncbi:MAG: hypothetical protein Q8L97_11005 [Nitrosomonas sp.]|uniref:integrase arm-type DNA-binding domain-containing protein n=1 Tax=Nitrosomonas sp. TaxID=42353 RepID=UPI00272F52D6|nr:integrase arm-type DNA-binding domain-containing protein [Nitrosomonas sp.]MDP1550664.1 hypothetical protein [Nitrosomonas sp.]